MKWKLYRVERPRNGGARVIFRTVGTIKNDTKWFFVIVSAAATMKEVVTEIARRFAYLGIPESDFVHPHPVPRKRR